MVFLWEEKVDMEENNIVDPATYRGKVIAKDSVEDEYLRQQGF